MLIVGWLCCFGVITCLLAGFMKFVFVLLGHFGVLDLKSLVHIFLDPEQFLLLKKVQLRFKMFSFPQFSFFPDFLQLNFRQQHFIALTVVHQQLALNRGISRLLLPLINYLLIKAELSHNQFEHRNIKPLILLQLIFQPENLRKLPFITASSLSIFFSRMIIE